MKTVGIRFMGRFGNQLFQYAFARALAEKNGYRLETDDWPGRKIFGLTEPLLSGGYNANGDGDRVFLSGYFQAQKDLIYTREQVRRWFTIKPELQAMLETIVPKDDEILGHQRKGDYFGKDSIFVVVSKQAIRNAVALAGYDVNKLRFVTEEEPLRDARFGHGLEFLPDFYRLMRAPVLFRANSTFSWWAATLGHGKVYSPVIDGLPTGTEQDNVPFVAGNHPRNIASLDFVTDLHLT